MSIPANGEPVKPSAGRIWQRVLLRGLEVGRDELMAEARAVQRPDLVAVVPDQVRSALRVAAPDQLLPAQGELEHEVPGIGEVVDEDTVVAQPGRAEQYLDEPLQPGVADRPE